ncbi:uncharacterized protein DUF4282 [Kushneria sinocarnis]|uniref:Uncharacterized protein DUF4282 n=1 Tax=Kushneria sinocarnis TaxID=595502 RepID=A0A420WZW3_9GAMM|nr:DUF4282 domain-containing protein [Kushneria sinocarnis]RKR06891.1 uncharacterized protein DUF4282 [Kushneria sinocarnis]
MKFSDLVSFDRFVSPTLIRIGYWIGIAMIILSGLSAAISAVAGYGGSIGTAFMIVMGTLVTLIFWRVFCELAFLLFAIHDRLGELKPTRERGDEDGHS